MGLARFNCYFVAHEIMGDGSFHGNQHTPSDWIGYEYADLVEDISALAESLDRSPTTSDAERADSLPSIRLLYRILDGREWNEMLSDAGLEGTQVGEYGPQERSRILRDIQHVFEASTGDYLTVREYDTRGDYNKSVLKRLFGTWSTACAKAGVPHGRKHGRKSVGPEGAVLDSALEAEIARALFDRGLIYEAHKPIPYTKWLCDFYLEQSAFWIEVDGYLEGERPNQLSFSKKLRHYRLNEMQFAVVRKVTELEDKVFQRI